MHGSPCVRFFLPCAKKFARSRDPCSGAGGASAVWALVSPWTKGKASKCHNVGCRTVSEGGTAAGLAVCKRSCRDGCNLINFVPNGADGTSGPGRCCRRKCTSSNDLKLVSKWKGWDVYTKSDGATPAKKAGRNRSDVADACCRCRLQMHAADACCRCMLQMHAAMQLHNATAYCILQAYGSFACGNCMLPLLLHAAIA